MKLGPTGFVEKDEMTCFKSTMFKRSVRFTQPRDPISHGQTLFMEELAHLMREDGGFWGGRAASNVRAALRLLVTRAGFKYEHD